MSKEMEKADFLKRCILTSSPGISCGTVAKKKKKKHLCNGLFSRTAHVSRHQKAKTILDFNEAKDDGVAVASAEPYATHLHFASDR